MIGLWVLIGTLAGASVAGVVWRRTHGRVRTRSEVRLLPAKIRDAVDPAAQVTLVQLSTTFCAPCRRARAMLGNLAERTPELHHTEIDVTNEPDLVRELGVLRTPTTLAVDAGGRELFRVSGVPDRGKLLSALRLT